MSADRVHALELQVAELTREVRALDRRLATLEEPEPAAAPPPPTAAAAEPAAAGRPEGPAGEGRSWVLGRLPVLLARSAVVCLLLVFALVLRTLADAGVLGLQLGSALGLAYAGSLVVAGAVLARRARPLAGLFCGTGTVLLCSVVFESYGRFGALPADLGYGILGAAALLVAWGRRGRSVGPSLALVTLAVLATGIGLQALKGSFPHLSALTFTTLFLARAAAHNPAYVWLRLVVHLTAGLLHLTWAAALSGSVAPASGTASVLLLALVLFGAFSWGTAGIAWSGRGGAPAGWLDGLVPPFVASWIGGAAWLGAGAGLLGVGVGLGELFAGALLLVAGGGLRRRAGVAPASFVTAALILGTAALAGPLGSPALAVATLAGAALATGWSSTRPGLGALRAPSYAAAVAALALALISDVAAAAGPQAILRGGCLALLAGAALAQYRWARRTPPPAGSWFFSRVDKTDDSAVLLLLVAVGGLFLALRVAAHPLLATWVSDLEGAFLAFQSALINAAALALLFIAVRHANTEIRGVAVLVFLIGAVRVFVHDLLAARGVSLLVSVSSFGLAAAWGSLLLSRWSARTPAHPDSQQEQSP